MTSGQPDIARILYKEIVEGDRRKADAKSNDSASGGGARDFRFPYQAVLPVVELIFPQQIVRRGKTVHRGAFSWREPGSTQIVVKDAEFMSPTRTRPAEGRISQVSKFSCFDTDRIPKSGAGNRVLLLLIQLYDQSVWPHFAEETTLRVHGEWHPSVANELLSCMDAERRTNCAVIGFIDFARLRRFCNDK
jgi:hypothetical protein